MPAQDLDRALRLLVFNLTTDADDPLLGFTTAWLNELAVRCRAVDVITMRAGRLAVRENVRVFSLGKEKGYSEARRAVEFYRALVRLLAGNRYDACFAHMNPLFAVMGAPLLAARGIPITLWYTHKAVGPVLRVAERIARRVVTASPQSFRLPSHKVLALGHGIDTKQFAPGEMTESRSFTIGSVGRIAPAKRIDTLIEAARCLVHGGVSGFQVRLVGPVLAQDDAYAARLRTMVADEGLADAVLFAGEVPFGQVVEEYHRLDVMVNMSLTGSIDKAVLEAMACGVLVVTGNEAFVPVLGAWRDLLLVPQDAPEVLASRLKTLMNMPPAERRALGLKLRQIVVESHSLDRLMDRLVEMWETDTAHHGQP